MRCNKQKNLAMKTKYLFVFASVCILSLSGCSSQPSIDGIDTPDEEFFPVQFSVQMEKEIISFPTTRSIPDNSIPEPHVSKADAGGTELKDLCTQIDYIVFEQKEEIPVLVKHRTFTLDESDLDAEFGIVYDSLPKGNYQFCFVAHGSEATTLSGTALTFDKVTDTFYKTLHLEIDAAEEINQDITLNRIVSRIEFMATDPVSDILKQFDMCIEGDASRLNLTDGSGIVNTESRTIPRTFTPEEIGQTNTINGFYTFIASPETKLSVRLTAIGQTSETIRERNIRDITPAMNKIIRYKGRLYSRSESDDTFQVSIFNEGKWDEPEEVVLPEYEK